MAHMSWVDMHSIEIMYSALHTGQYIELFL